MDKDYRCAGVQKLNHCTYATLGNGYIGCRHLYYCDFKRPNITEIREKEQTEITIIAVKDKGKTCFNCIFDRLCSYNGDPELLMEEKGLPNCDDGYIYKVKEK